MKITQKLCQGAYCEEETCFTINQIFNISYKHFNTVVFVKWKIYEYGNKVILHQDEVGYFFLITCPSLVLFK